MDSNVRFLVGETVRPSWETGLLSRKRERICWGTEGSNPSPSSGESCKPGHRDGSRALGSYTIGHLKVALDQQILDVAVAQGEVHMSRLVGYRPREAMAATKEKGDLEVLSYPPLISQSFSLQGRGRCEPREQSPSFNPGQTKADT